MWGIVLVISTMPHFITTHSINNPNYIKMQQNKNQQLDAKFRKFIKVLIMEVDHLYIHPLQKRQATTRSETVRYPRAFMGLMLTN